MIIAQPGTVPGSFEIASAERPATAAAATAALSDYEEATDVSESSGATVLAVSALVHQICEVVGSAATGANLR